MSNRVSVLVKKKGPNSNREFDALLKEGKPLPNCFLAYYMKELQHVDRKVHTDIAVAAEVNHDVAAHTGLFGYWIEVFCQLSQVLLEHSHSFKVSTNC